MLQTFSTECFIVQTVFSDRERAGKGLKNPESLIVSGGDVLGSWDISLASLRGTSWRFIVLEKLRTKLQRLCSQHNLDFLRWTQSWLVRSSDPFVAHGCSARYVRRMVTFHWLTEVFATQRSQECVGISREFTKNVGTLTVAIVVSHVWFSRDCIPIFFASPQNIHRLFFFRHKSWLAFRNLHEFTCKCSQ